MRPPTVSSPVWMSFGAELLAKQMSLEQVQAYVLLRESRLSADDNKRVLVESGAEASASGLESKKAIRMLGSAFFQDYTGVKREKTMKTYDHLAFNVDDHDEHDKNDIYWAHDEVLDDEMIAQMANDDDEDAALVVQFEDAVSDAVQSDPELAAPQAVFFLHCR